MSMENVKTIVLINLVVISLFLTFNLWTYVPDSTSMQNAKFVQGMKGLRKLKSLMLSALLLSSCIKIKIIMGAKRGDIESIYKPLEAGNYMISKRYRLLRLTSFLMCMVKEN